MLVGCCGSWSQGDGACPPWCRSTSTSARETAAASQTGLVAWQGTAALSDSPASRSGIVCVVSRPCSSLCSARSGLALQQKILRSREAFARWYRNR